MMNQPINGLVLVNKPTQLTSNAVLQRVKKLFKAKKAGHTGSLDPLATGMLPICLGEATKVSQFLLDADKCYAVTGRLGITTDTGDSMGKILQEAKSVHVTHTQLEETVAAFQGAIQQIPPMFSALKHQGKPLYKLARQGIEIERSPREVMIYKATLLDFDGLNFQLNVTCSKGTYIRTLIMDIGEKLGAGAHVTALHRLYTAGFADEPMWTLDELMEKNEQELARSLLPIDRAILHLPPVYLSSEEAKGLFQGRVIRNKADIPAYLGDVRLYMPSEIFMGIGRYDHQTESLKAKRLLNLLPQ